MFIILGALKLQGDSGGGLLSNNILIGVVSSGNLK